ncbi:MAG: tetratricopeptide repeat protein [Alphaproteobacteria bacterium]|nr:tetratricopeptide repeat protein [Alphaproteobacteria bacterium]
MTDIFHEVEEEVRKERLEKLWKQYGDYVIAAVAVIVLGVVGYKLWQAYEARQQMKAASAYMSAIQMSDQGRNDMAAAAFENIAKTAPSGYALVARFSRADSLAASGRASEAVAIYMDIAGKDKSGLGDLARIRAAWVQADTLSRANLQALLAPLLADDSPWRFMSREILAYRDFEDGRMAQAQREYQSLANDPNAPSGLRQRTRAMATLIRTGVRDYGKVPPLVTPKQTPAGGQQGSPTP